MAQPEREVRGLRNDLRVACEALAGRVGGVASQLVVDGEALAELAPLRSDVDALVADVGGEGGLGVRLLGQVAPLETVPSSGARDDSEGDFTSLEAAVLQSTETTNSDLWGLAGLFTGFLTLVALFKVVRP